MSGHQFSHRQRSWAATAAAVALLCSVLGALPTRAAPPGLAASSPAAGAPSPRLITLVTGEVLQVGAGADGKLSVATRGDDGAGLFARFTDAAGDLHVVPARALSLIPERLDPRLFNVSALLRDGYGAASEADSAARPLPLIVTYTGAPVSMPGAILRRELPSIAGAAITLTDDGSRALGAALADGGDGLQGVEKIWLDGRMTASLDESVPQIEAPSAWEQGYDGTDVTIAVVDTGIDESHPDLAGRVVAAELFAEADSVTDVVGHGTHVASIAAGDGAASDGQYTGVAYGAELVNAKVLDDSGFGLESWVIAGMEWAAADQDADIVNLSLTGGQSDGSDPVSQAVDALTAEEGALFVTAAGNFGGFPESIETPATAASALAVGAVDKSDVLAFFSAWGPPLDGTSVKPEIVAPGVAITAARAEGSEIGLPVGDDYMELDGTSMAAPHVAGAAALLLQAHPDWTWAQLKSALVTTGADVGATVFQQGGGRVDVGAALAQQVHSDVATLDLGALEFPHDDGEMSTAEVTLTNDGAADVSVDLTVAATNDDGEPATEGMIAVEPASLDLAAGASGTVTVTFDAATGPVGLFGGRLVASVGDAEALHIPLSFEKEAQLVDLTIDVIERDGVDDLFGLVTIQNVDDMEAYFEQLDVFTGDQTVTARVPLGAYSVNLLSFQSIGADRLDVVGVIEPELAIDADTEIVLDSNVTNEITYDVGDVVTPLDATIGVYRASEGSDFGSDTAFGAAGREVRAFVNATETAETGAFEFYSKWTLTGEDDRWYDLIFPEPDEVPPVVDYTVGPDDVAEITTKFHSEVNRDYLDGRFFFRPYAFGSFILLFPVDVPVARTDWVTADDTAWEQTVDVGGSNSFASYFEGLPTTYEPGVQLENDWVQPPNRPAFTYGVRDADTLYVGTAAWTDADNHPGYDAFVFEGDSYDEFELTLRSDGEVVGTSEAPYGEFALPAGPASYEMTLTASRDIDWWKHSTETSTTWWFESEPAEVPTEVALAQVDYELDLSLRNSTDAPNKITFRPAHDLVSPTISGLDASWSIDDGDTWTPLELTPRDDLGFEATVPVPASCDPSCFVSLQLTAHGTTGPVLEQQVIRAYSATYVAPTATPTTTPPTSVPPSVPPTTGVPTTTLPGTGGGSSQLLAGFGLAAIVLGGLALVIARRRLLTAD